MKIKIVLSCAFIAIVFLNGCTKQGDVGQSSLLNLITEPPGPNCPNGGVKVVSGVDANRNNVLEDNEIQNIKYVCNASPGAQDKQVILYFPANGVAYSTTSATGYVDSIEVIRDFNISNYGNADSINFSAYLQTTDSSVSCTLNLYDSTNKAVIPNTTLTSNSTGVESKTTQVNFFGNLPQSTIKLGIQVLSGLEGTEVRYYLPMITIYRP